MSTEEERRGEESSAVRLTSTERPPIHRTQHTTNTQSTDRRTTAETGEKQRKREAATRVKEEESSR